MDNIQIDLGVKRLAVNGDESRIIEFNPSDLLFVERFYNLIQTFEEKDAEYRQRAEKIDANTKLDTNGIPVNALEAIALVKEMCSFMCEQIDKVFGEGTSQAAFGNVKTINMFEQFFDGITPYIEQVRQEKIDKYVVKRKGKS